MSQLEQALSPETASTESQTRSLRHFFIKRHPEIWIAVVLWIASNLFVTTFATFARWEYGAPYVKYENMCRWDCAWYASVVDGGYDRSLWREGGHGNWPFHPLFPITAYPLHHWLKFSTARSVVLAGKLGLLFAIYAFLLMLRNDSRTATEKMQAGSLVALNPYLVYAHAGYAEPLYFALLAMGFYWLARYRWIGAGLMGALASAARILGFLFSVSYLVAGWKSGQWRSAWRRRDLGLLVGLMLCPLGTALFMLYMYHLSGDAMAQVHVQYAWGKSVGVDPWHVLVLSLKAHSWPRVWGCMVLVALAAGVWLVRLGKTDLAVFLFLSVLVPLLSGSPLGLPRYIWWQPPFLYAVFRGLQRFPSLWVVYTGLTAGMASFMILAWFSGHAFVV